MSRKPPSLSWNDPKVINQELSLKPGKGFWSYKQIIKSFAGIVIPPPDLPKETILCRDWFIAQIIVKLVNGYSDFHLLYVHFGRELWMQSCVEQSSNIKFTDKLEFSSE